MAILTSENIPVPGTNHRTSRLPYLSFYKEKKIPPTNLENDDHFSDKQPRCITGSYGALRINGIDRNR